jgi:hypothetical protein
MMFLQIVGWLAITALALYTSVAAWGMFYMVMGFAGKVSWSAILLAVFSLCLWITAFIYSPFSITWNQ